MTRLISKILTSSLLSLSLISAYAIADEALEAGKLYKSGQLNEALKKAETILSQNPKDAQMRFLKGIIYAEQNKSVEAINIFTKLTDDYPTLPEPYNNLAVLYASSGQYLKASAALEMAIRTNPTYGTAHENLGDVYAKLASQAYDKALQLDSANSTAKLKLNLVKNLIGNTTGGTNPKLNPKVSPTNTSSLSAPTVNQAAAAISPSNATPIVSSNLPKTVTKAIAKPANSESDSEQLLSAVNSWAKAWSDQNMQKYLGSYAKDFETGKNQSRSAWEEERRQRIEGKNKINIRIENTKVTVQGSLATVKFKQHYSSDRLSSSSTKTLSLIKQNGKWLILQERSGN
jgi:Flp pilus assembly protein TadD